MDGVNVGREMRDVVGALERGNPDLSAAARVRAAWARVASPAAREHVTGVFVVPGTGASELVVYTDTALWATELGMQAELVRLKLNAELARVEGAAPGAGGEVPERVRKLRFTVSKRKYLARDRRQGTYEQLREEDEALARVEPVPLTAAEDAELRAAAAGVSDERLRAAAYGAAKASLEWRRGLDAAEGGGTGDGAS